jgi:hypothetical protein
LICPGETKNKGAAIPPIVTALPPSIVGSGVPDADCWAAAKLVPKIATIPPGAVGEAHEAQFTTPAFEITGACAKSVEASPKEHKHAAIILTRANFTPAIL